MNCNDIRQEKKAYNCSDIKQESQENLTNTALKSRIAQLQITNSKAEIEIEALKSKNSSLSDDLLAERSEKLSTIRSLSEQITTLLHENEKLSQAADNNEQIVALKKKNLSLSDELLAERSEKLSTIRSLREQITKLLDENKKLSQAVNNNNTWHEANCDSCGLQIKGCRYKCGHCANFDLCDACIGSSHNFDHMFLKIRYPIYIDPRIILLPKFVFETMDTNVHTEISCDICGINPICGIRYRCGHCQNFDMCGKCELNHRETNYRNHDSSHVFIRIIRPIHRAFYHYYYAPLLSKLY